MVWENWCRYRYHGDCCGFEELGQFLQCLRVKSLCISNFCSNFARFLCLMEYKIADRKN